MSVLIMKLTTQFKIKLVIATDELNDTLLLLKRIQMEFNEILIEMWLLIWILIIL